uniref:Uncharacterized protein n=1 Tax=Oryzias latipes TaxID=8090 RepID=A0A3P9KBY4_ORYLA
MLFKANIKNNLCHRAGQYGQKITSLIFSIPNSILIEFFSPYLLKGSRSTEKKNTFSPLILPQVGSFLNGIITKN